MRCILRLQGNASSMPCVEIMEELTPKSNLLTGTEKAVKGQTWKQPLEREQIGVVIFVNSVCEHVSNQMDVGCSNL